MGMATAGSMVVEKERTIAEDICVLAADLSSRAELLAATTRDRLSPITTQPSPQNQTLKEGKPLREYPPLFAQLRDEMFSIQTSLERIEDVMSRVAL